MCCHHVNTNVLTHFIVLFLYTLHNDHHHEMILTTKQHKNRGANTGTKNAIKKKEDKTEYKEKIERRERERERRLKLAVLLFLPICLMMAKQE